MLSGLADLCIVGNFWLHVFPKKVTQTALGKHPESSTKLLGPNYFEFTGPNHEISQLQSLVSCNLPVQQKQELLPSTVLLPCEILDFCPGSPQSAGAVGTVFGESRFIVSS